MVSSRRLPSGVPAGTSTPDVVPELVAGPSVGWSGAVLTIVNRRSSP